MYIRDFGGVRSDGELSELREELRRDESKPEPIFNLNALRRLEVDDLLLMAIGALLLLDSDGSNDLTVLLIAALLFL